MLIFEGPAPAYEDFLNHIRSRLHLVPRYRHKLAFPPLETGRPIWIDDPSFNLEYHVRHTALPAAGVARSSCARWPRASTPSGWTGRSRCGRLWLVQGLEDGRFALISKTHHALVDGISGVDLMTVLFDLTPVPQIAPHEGEPWAAQPEPSAVAARRARVQGPRASCRSSSPAARSPRPRTRPRRWTPSRRRWRASARSPGPG